VFGSEFTPDFQSIVGQQRPKRILHKFLKRDRIPHALLFSGPDGLGKLATALLFAMRCNCGGLVPEDGISSEQAAGKGEICKSGHDLSPCSNCPSCRKIRSGSHPDVILIKPSGATIKIGQIREVIGILTRKPYEARQRFVIIANAHLMTPESANSLLKILEEPPNQTMIVLTVSHPLDLLPTITSRCQHIRFCPVPKHELEEHLVENEGVSPAEAAILSAMSEGSSGQAVEMLHSGWLDRRRWLLAFFDGSRPEASLPKTANHLLGLSESLARDKAHLHEALAVVKSWFRDLLIAGSYPEGIVNQDYIEQIRSRSPGYDAQTLLEDVSAIQTVEKQIQKNANSRLLTDILMMRLAEYMA